MNSYSVEEEDLRYPKECYRNMQEFFTRALPDGVRTLESVDPGDILSPVDGEVTSLVELEVTDGRVPQIYDNKGSTFSIDAFLGKEISPMCSDKDSKLMCLVIYLAPGDYHRFHSPTELCIHHAIHFDGELFPVNKSKVKYLPDLFNVNERVILHGNWKHGLFFMGMVAAQNVGGIELSFDKKLQTNRHRVTVSYMNLSGGTGKNFHEKFQHGQELGKFKMGSTVVLVFQAPRNMKFHDLIGQRVKLGQNFVCKNNE